MGDKRGGINLQLQNNSGSRRRLKHAPGFSDKLGPKQLHLTPDSTREQVPSPPKGRLSASPKKTGQPGEGAFLI